MNSRYCVIVLCFMWMGTVLSTSKELSSLGSDHNKSAIAPTIVLTLDVSESMESRRRIDKLSDSLRLWIEAGIPDGTRLGMVQFSTSEKLLSDLVTVDSENRAQLVELIPKMTYGETCIGCGLRLALRLLESTKSGGTIILITDVENSEPGQNVKDMFDQVLQAKVKIITIAIGNGAKLDDIEQLAMLTDGRVYSFSDKEGVDALYKLLKEALQVSQVELLTTDIVTLETTADSLTDGKTHDFPMASFISTVPDLSSDLATIIALNALPDLSTQEDVNYTTSATEVLEGAASSSLFVIIGIAAGIFFSFVIVVIFIVLFRRNYRIVRIQDKYSLVNVSLEQSTSIEDV